MQQKLKSSTGEITFALLFGMDSYEKSNVFLVCFLFSSVIPTSLLYENINSKAYFTLTNIGKGRIPIGGAVSAFVPPLSQIITSSRSWSFTKKGSKFQLCLCLELLPSLFIFEERICERSGILSISSSSSRAIPPIGLFGFPLRLARALSQVLLGASHPEGLLIRGFFVASPVFSIDRKKDNLIVDTFLASFSRVGRYASKEGSGTTTGTLPSGRGVGSKLLRINDSLSEIRL